MIEPVAQNAMVGLGLSTADDTMSVSLPECLEVDTRWKVNLYAEGCLDCSSLVQKAQNDFSGAKCHFNQGNVHCPAKEIQIYFVGSKVLAIKRIRAAQAKGDSQALIRQLTKLSEMDEEDRNAVLEAVGLVLASPGEASLDDVTLPESEVAESNTVNNESEDLAEVDC